MKYLRTSPGAMRIFSPRYWQTPKAAVRPNLFLFHDDLRRAPLETMRRLYGFLGLDPADLLGAPARENVALAGFSRPLFVVSNRLRLDRVLPRKVLAILRTALSQIGSRTEMSPQSRDWLRDHYEPHNRRLEALVGRDLAAWDR